MWALTPEGEQAELDHAAALELFRDVLARFKTIDNEDEAAPETVSGHDLFTDPERRFWFVGAVWDGERPDGALPERGNWQNGYDDKFAEHIARMRPGDRIAIKASFVQKYKLPFDNLGKPVSCMRIKAIGTITENVGDGKTVKVDWERLDPPRDWFFYTYRVTVVEADPSDELARRLILFAFAGAKQDYSYWTNEVPYFAKKYGAEAKPARTRTFSRPTRSRPRKRRPRRHTQWPTSLTKVAFLHPNAGEHSRPDRAEEEPGAAGTAGDRQDLARQEARLRPDRLARSQGHA